LHIAAHLDHIETRIQPALRNGTHVVLDRFWWSTWVYGRAVNVQTRVLDLLIDAERAAWVPTEPSHVFLVNRAVAFRPEHNEEFYFRLSGLYTQLASLEGKRYAVTTLSNDSIEGSVQSLREKLDQLF